MLQFTTARYPSSWRVAAVAASLFTLFVVKLTGSRLGMIGCLAAFPLSIGAWAALKWRGDRTSLLAPAVILAMPIAVLVSLVGIVELGTLRHFVWGPGASSASDDGRRQQWAMGLPKVISHPWGYGIGMGGETLGFAPFGFLTIDSYYLSAMLEFGIIGFFLFYGVFFSAIYYCGKVTLNWRGQDREMQFLVPLAISMIIFLIDSSVFSQTDNFWLAFMILGMIVALVDRANNERDAADMIPGRVLAPTGLRQARR
jgi:hypothetical protein